jgi:hypothetical protein
MAMAFRKISLTKIFQPFFTTKPTGQGTGLGLSLAYDIVKAHGGELKVETKEPEGSEFVIQLPATSNIHKSYNPINLPAGRQVVVQTIIKSTRRCVKSGTTEGKGTQFLLPFLSPNKKYTMNSKSILLTFYPFSFLQSRKPRYHNRLPGSAIISMAMTRATHYCTVNSFPIRTHFDGTRWWSSCMDPANVEMITKHN